MTGNDGKLIATFASEIEAEIAREHLRVNSIEAYIRTDDTGHMFPPLQKTQGVLLIVAAADEARARECLYGTGS